MKKLSFSAILCIFLFLAFTVAAQNYRNLGTQDGVDVLAAIDPLGPNNLVSVYVKFINKNSYDVNVKWTPLITCQGGTTRKGYGADFSMKAGGSYEVTIWRSGACGEQQIKDLNVEMEVKRAGFY